MAENSPLLQSCSSNYDSTASTPSITSTLPSDIRVEPDGDNDTILDLRSIDYTYTNPSAPIVEAAWFSRAKRALAIHNENKGRMWKRWSWTNCLHFPRPDDEKAYRWYFTQLRGSHITASLLLVVCLYLLTAMSLFSTSWSTAQLVLRSIYVVGLLTGFTFAFTRWYQTHLRLISCAISLLSGLEIVAEGALRHAVYSPWLVLILTLYLFASTTFIRLEMTFSIFTLFALVASYDTVCLAFFFHGDKSTPSHEVASNLFWFNLVLLGAVFINILLTRRYEISRRQEFLTSCHFEEHQRLSMSLAPNALPFSDAGPSVDTHTSTTIDLLFQQQPSNLLTLMLQLQACSTHSQTDQETLIRSIRDAGGSLRNLFVQENDDCNLVALSPAFRVAKRISGFFTGFHINASPICLLIDVAGDYSLKRTCYELVSIDQLPEYFVGYPGVISGYRTNFTSGLCRKSIFKWHNETINIWTEFIPFLVFLVSAIMYCSVSQHFQHAVGFDRVTLLIGMVGLVIRPLCSGLAHVFFCQSHRAYIFWWGIDYISICFMVLCGSITFGRFSFYCFHQLQVFFYLSICGLFCSTMVCVLFVPSLTVRAASYTLFVIFANGAPLVFQVTRMYHSSAHVPSSYVFYWGAALITALIGLVFKSSAVPEKFWPGMFDRIGSSHQIWHLFVNSGHVFMFIAWEMYLRWRASNPCLPE